MPSSSLVEVAVEFEVGVWVKMQFSSLTFLGGWVGGVGWLENSDIKLISTQVVIEVKVGVEIYNWMEIDAT